MSHISMFNIPSEDDLIRIYPEYLPYENNTGGGTSKMVTNFTKHVQIF